MIVESKECELKDYCNKLRMIIRHKKLTKEEVEHIIGKLGTIGVLKDAYGKYMAVLLDEESNESDIEKMSRYNSKDSTFERGNLHGHSCDKVGALNRLLECVINSADNGYKLMMHRDKDLEDYSYTYKYELDNDQIVKTLVKEYKTY